MTESAPPGSATLRRALGRWDLAAIGINQTIGGAVFLMPSQIAAAVGAWSPFAILGGTLVTMVVAVSLAEVGSRFEATGGPYLYARTAFGRFAAFEVGWMQWFARVTSHASVANGLALALGYYWAGAAQGIGRAAVITTITAVLTLVNVLGIKQGARTVNAAHDRQARAAGPVHRHRRLLHQPGAVHRAAGRHASTRRRRRRCSRSSCSAGTRC